MQRKGLSEDQAKKLIKEVDKDRASYYKYYTDQIWGESENYDLCIDSSRIGVKGAVEVIKAYLSALEQKDKYELFLGGNYGKAVITTGVENGKHLLLVKDSFANSFVPFLTGDYETITMLDLRYFRGSVQELAAEADDILVLTEITNLAASGEYFKLGK